MLRSFENLFALIVLILTEAWFLKDYFDGNAGFEPLIAFIFAFVTLVKNLFPLNTKHLNHDRELYDLFIKTLPVAETENFFGRWDFNNSFSKSYILGLNEFVLLWSNSDKEFFTLKLEKQKKSLYKLACNLSREIVTRTVPIGEGENLSVFSDSLRAISYKRPQSVVQDAKIINECANEFNKQYLVFIRECKSRLYAN